MRRAVVFLALSVVVSGCGTATLSVSEYAVAAEALVVKMEADFLRIDSQWDSSPATVDGAIHYWERRLEIRHEFLEGIEGLDPPEVLVTMHETALDIFRRLNAADQRAADSVRGYSAINDNWQWDYTPEGRTVLAVMEEVYSFCRSAQAELDTFARGSAFGDMPWVPSEMSDSVGVAFDCPPPP